MPKIINEEALDLLLRRHKAQKDWLTNEAPYTSEEQRHLDANTPEQAYWHHGYFSALTDILDMLERGLKG